MDHHDRARLIQHKQRATLHEAAYLVTTSLRGTWDDAVSLLTDWVQAGRLPADVAPDIGGWSGKVTAPIDPSRTTVAVADVKALLETLTKQAGGDRITVEWLAWLLSAAQADEQPEKWRKSDDDSLRRMLVIVQRLHGWKPSTWEMGAIKTDDIEGVIPQIAEMAQAGMITLRSLDGAATTPTAKGISANQAGWWMTADDAQRLIAALYAGARQYTITAVAESIAKRVHPNDYIAEHALKTSLIAEMNAAAERGDLPTNERRHGETWVSEYEVDDWLARERKPYRLSVRAQSNKEQADMERAGRRRIKQIAETLANETDVDVARWEKTIADAVKAERLPLKNPRNLADSLPYPVPQNLRAFYDCVDVADVDRWLEANPAWGVAYRFTVEASAPAVPEAATVAAESQASPAAIGTPAIAIAFDGLGGWDDKQWRRNLASPAKWLLAARVTAGKKGKHPATWNPVTIAIALSDKVQLSSLDAVFKKRAVQAWVGEWEDKSAYLRE